MVGKDSELVSVQLEIRRRLGKSHKYGARILVHKLLDSSDEHIEALIKWELLFKRLHCISLAAIWTLHFHNLESIPQKPILHTVCSSACSPAHPKSILLRHWRLYDTQRPVIFKQPKIDAALIADINNIYLHLLCCKIKVLSQYQGCRLIA